MWVMTSYKNCEVCGSRLSYAVVKNDVLIRLNNWIVINIPELKRYGHGKR